VAVGAPRRPAVRRNGPGPYTGVPRVRVAVEEPAYGEEELLVARVRLLEGLVSRTEIADCAQLALQWLGDVLGFRQSICLVRPAGEQSLFVVAVNGLGGSAFTSFSVSLEDWANPLVSAFTHRKELFFPVPHSTADRKRRPSTPFEDSASLKALDGVLARSTGVVTNSTMVRPAARQATTKPNTTLIIRPIMSAPDHAT